MRIRVWGAAHTVHDTHVCTLALIRRTRWRNRLQVYCLASPSRQNTAAQCTPLVSIRLAYRRLYHQRRPMAVSGRDVTNTKQGRKQMGEKSFTKAATRSPAVIVGLFSEHTRLCYININNYYLFYTA